MTVFCQRPIPARAGIGLRSGHYQAFDEMQPAVDWIEVHPENYFGNGGPTHYYLQRARQHYPLSFHGVGLSLGSADALNESHLRRLKLLVERYQPDLISEHLAWGSIDGRYLHDLLPLPFTRETVQYVAARIDYVQEFLGRPILIENISAYFRFQDHELEEAEFIAEVAKQAGCGILLDINNVYVNATNHGFDPVDYLQSIPPYLVSEMHLAGFTRKQFEHGEILIDTHNHPVADTVWNLYREALECFGAVPVLIEWDIDLPALPVLVGEAHKANRIIREQNYELTG